MEPKQNVIVLEEEILKKLQRMEYLTNRINQQGEELRDLMTSLRLLSTDQNLPQELTRRLEASLIRFPQSLLEGLNQKSDSE